MGDCWNTATCDTGYELKVRAVEQEKMRVEKEKWRAGIIL